MTRGRKRNKFKEWLSGLFVSKDKVYHTPDGPQLPSGTSNNSRSVAVNNTIYVQGVGNTVTRQDGQGDRQMLVTQVMNLLSQHIIRGAAHDDSARHPPPRCHPDTRVKLIARITTWFNGKAQQELLLWLTGPAGVGKSAIIQTFAEYLAKNRLLGASVFISRPNRRNNPHRIFVTIAYQLSIRIRAYRNFIAEQLSIDPELPNRGMAAQFTAFIVEPFVNKKIGAGGQRWGILLDGLDELAGEDEQCHIIRLIATFAHEYRDAPLVWIIASRQEPHISNTFDDDVNRSHWSEYIPIDSTEACEDVERFLRSSFETTRKKFRQCVPEDWPSDTEFLKLIAAASGLFVYAEVVMQFIGDPAHNDPAARLEILLSVIDRSNTVPTKENPFVHLDAIYREILSSIPSAQWPLTKRLLSYTIHVEQIDFRVRRLLVSGRSMPQSFQTLRGMAVLFGLPLHVVYACLLKCHSTLRVPDRKVAHKKNLTFLHASFADFLKDSARSREFHVGDAEEIENDVALCIIDIWNTSSGSTASVSVESTWYQHCSKWNDKASSRIIAEFHATLFRDITTCVRRVLYFIFYERREDPTLYVPLREIHMIKLCYSLDVHDFEFFVNTLLNYTSDINDTELLQKVQLKNLKFGSPNWGEASFARARYGRKHTFSREDLILHRPRSSTELETFMSELASLQERSPELEVAIFGGVREGRVAAFQDDGCYIVPYFE